MSELTREQIEQVLDARVRPFLAQHDGDIQVISVEDGVLRFRMLGQCGNCPSAVVTAEELVAPPLKEALPEIKQVVLDTSVSDEIWDMAKSILRSRREQRDICASE
jgi:Fe-S cluster biogenesis protein NfuA